MYEKLLVCLDGSDFAEQIMPYLVDLASRLGSKMLLLEVVTETPTISAGDPGVVVKSLDTISRSRREAETYLESIAAPLRARGLGVECAVLEGPAGETIVQYSEKSHMDLIALSTHGRGGLGRAVFGSVADYVMRHSTVPFLCVRPRHTEK
jgi:nucleotide-binding universal stress UspA family protein